MASSRNKQAAQGRPVGEPMLASMAPLLQESTRAAAATAAEGRGEERISVFWRVFGGTILSIVALVALTVYQQTATNLNDLRAAVNHLTENQAELVRKEDLAGRTSPLWSSVQGLENDMASAKTRLAVLEAQVHDSEQHRGELKSEVQTLRERLASLEGRYSTTRSTTRLGEKTAKVP